MSVNHLYLAAVTAILGCAGSGTRTPVAPRTATYLSAAEVASANADMGTAYQAVARLRPNWLAAHGISTFETRGGSEYAMVYIDGQRHGALESLRGIPASQVRDFRYYDVTQAGATFGRQAGTGGVIEVRTK